MRGGAPLMTPLSKWQQLRIGVPMPQVGTPRRCRRGTAAATNELNQRRRGKHRARRRGPQWSRERRHRGPCRRPRLSLCPCPCPCPCLCRVEGDSAGIEDSDRTSKAKARVMDDCNGPVAPRSPNSPLLGAVSSSSSSWNAAAAKPLPPPLPRPPPRPPPAT